MYHHGIILLIPPHYIQSISWYLQSLPHCNFQVRVSSCRAGHLCQKESWCLEDSEKCSVRTWVKFKLTLHLNQVDNESCDTLSSNHGVKSVYAPVEITHCTFPSPLKLNRPSMFQARQLFNIWWMRERYLPSSCSEMYDMYTSLADTLQWSESWMRLRFAWCWWVPDVCGNW